MNSDWYSMNPFKKDIGVPTQESAVTKIHFHNNFKIALAPFFPLKYFETKTVFHTMHAYFPSFMLKEYLAHLGTGLDIFSFSY